MNKIYLFILFFITYIGNTQTIEIKYYQNVLFSPVTDTVIDAIKFKKSPDFNLFSYTIKYSNGVSLYTNENLDKLLGKSFTISDTIADDRINNYSIIFDKEYINSRKELLYKNYGKKVFTDRVLYSNQDFTLEDSFVNVSYKITSETKKILNYNCKKAIVKIGNSKYYYWFTDELGVVLNPSRFESVPGVVLEIQGLNTNYLAYDIKVKNNSTNIKKPEYSKPFYNYKELESKINYLMGK